MSLLRDILSSIIVSFANVIRYMNFTLERTTFKVRTNQFNKYSVIERKKNWVRYLYKQFKMCLGV